MIQVSFQEHVKIIYGIGSIKSTGALLKECGYKKVLIVHDAGVAGILAHLLNSLNEYGISYVQFDKVQPDPPAHIVAECSELCNRENCDAVIAFGGGSVIDTAKGVNILRFNEGPILRYSEPHAKMIPSPGLISIPTTAGTGSETSDGLIITDEEKKIKVPILASVAMSEYTILDAGLMCGMPPKLTAYTGLDALAHSCEAYTSTRSNPFTGLILEKVIETITTWLPIAVQDGSNLEAREHMAIASCLGGCMLTNNGTHAGHSFAHILGAKYHIPHGAACAYAEPYILEYNAAVIPEKIMQIGKIMGGEFSDQATPAEIGAVVRKLYISFYKSLGLPPITEFITEVPNWNLLAAAIMDEPFLAFNPRKMEHTDIIETLQYIIKL